jgi:hypothetical protein
MRAPGIVFFIILLFAESSGGTQGLAVSVVDFIRFTNSVVVWHKVIFMEWSLESISIANPVCVEISILFADSFSFNTMPFSLYYL